MQSDLAKFHHFGKILKLFANLWKVYLVFGKIVSLLWQTFCKSGKLSLL